MDETGARDNFESIPIVPTLSQMLFSLLHTKQCRLCLGSGSLRTAPGMGEWVWDLNPRAVRYKFSVPALAGQ